MGVGMGGGPVSWALCIVSFFFILRLSLILIAVWWISGMDSGIYPCKSIEHSPMSSTCQQSVTGLAEILVGRLYGRLENEKGYYLCIAVLAFAVTPGDNSVHVEVHI